MEAQKYEINQKLGEIKKAGCFIPLFCLFKELKILSDMRIDPYLFHA